MNRFLQKGNLKKRLSNREVTIGSWITIPSIEIVEIMSTAGFEWLVIDMEHTTISLDQAKILIHAIQSKGMDALVRVPDIEKTIIKKVLDFGADGIIVPMIKSKEDASQAVSYTQYPTKGTRGVGLNRAHNYGISFKEYKDWSKDNLVVVAQIEHIDAVSNIEEIINVDGIDATLIGPYDLSASMGYPGDYNRKEVAETLKILESKIKEHKFPLGFHVIESGHEFLNNKIKKGYNFIAFSIDFLFLGDKTRLEMKKIKREL